jgi:hypothetical protein
METAMFARSIGLGICFAAASLGRDLIRIVKRRRMAEMVEREQRDEVARMRRLELLRERAAITRSLRKLAGQEDATFDEMYQWDIDAGNYPHPAPAEAVTE